MELSKISFEMISRNNGRYVKLISNEIEYCIAEGNYTYVKIRGQNDTLLLCNNISYFESMLGSAFLRIHRSYLINIEFINCFIMYIRCFRNELELLDYGILKSLVLMKYKLKKACDLKL